MADIPLDSQEKFDAWLREVFYKKDTLLEEYMTMGRFPAMAGAKFDYVETKVNTRRPWEILQVFAVVGICVLLWNNVCKAWQLAKTLVGL